MTLCAAPIDARPATGTSVKQSWSPRGRFAPRGAAFGPRVPYNAPRCSDSRYLAPNETLDSAMPEPDKAFDCCSCGACCCVGLDVLLMPDEARYFQAHSELLALTLEHQRVAAPSLWFMKKDTTGRCVALTGALGDCYCTIYDRRPSLCRELEPGTEHCLAARRQMGYQD